MNDGEPQLSNRSNLQAEIKALADYPTKPESDWITRVQSCPVEVIAGAILAWMPSGGISSVTGDPMAPRRAAAQAIIQARLSNESVGSTRELRTTIDAYQQKSGRQTNAMLFLTIVIVILTIVQVVTIFQRPH